VSRITLLFAAACMLSVPALAQKRGSGWTPPAFAESLPDEGRSALVAADARYAERHTGDNATKVYDDLARLAAKHPDSFDVNWRLARAAFWLAEGTKDSARRKAIASAGWEAGKRAAAARPGAAEAPYFMALCIGEYSHSIGILTALAEGIEGKFRDPLLAVEKLDPAVDHGGVYNALGRYKYELPWPKRDVGASIDYLRKAVLVNPQNLRGRVFLAESLWARDDGTDRDEARRLLKEVVDAPSGRYDGPEELRAKELARAASNRLGL
jgi:hypothetical protein